MNTTTRTLLAAAITAFSFAAAPQAYAATSLNGLAVNGLAANGHSLSGQTALRPDDPRYCARKLVNYDPALCGNTPAAADASAQPVVTTIVLPSGQQLDLR